MLPAKGERWLVLPVAVRGSKTCVPNSLKLPCRISRVGTVYVAGSGWTSRRCSAESRKNVRSFTIGPDTVPVTRL